MKFDFNLTFNNLKKYLSLKVPEIGDIITHWIDPFTVTKARAILLPDSHSENGERIYFSVVLWVSTVEKNPDTITQSQINVMEKIFSAVYSSDFPVLDAGISIAEYYDPIPQSPNVGLMRVVINLFLEKLDDCD